MASEVRDQIRAYAQYVESIAPPILARPVARTSLLTRIVEALCRLRQRLPVGRATGCG